ncbi:N-acyl-D-amino-acid deacylase family protein [Selenihalanaerobacter shriftii]|uniref:N-acyl-D-amino-acid deacylase n=1 Tax=Selenihalanaerobacter shriftii TaxID=142842 RepID=A0A1T4MVA8_9FIRM|nr:D-aminoacylase [Selenihalanaerobacter shriftii]SJZ71050.1 N-acyl-D-amino-acid deacylase [Selenihalanaerobacter shriftii]
MNELLIKNGLIIDGTGQSRFKADLLIKNDRIFEIGMINQDGFNNILDAKGKIVSPGFIDTHSHSDLGILLDPYIEPKIRQGITTEVLGQDGISMAPLPLEYTKPWRKNLSGLNGDSDKLNWDWETTEGYLNLLEESGIGPNVSYLVPHGNIRMEAMGLDDRAATKDELKKMRQITRRSLEAGAVGLSTGLLYTPCAYANTEELIEMCKVVAEYDKVFVIHQRSEADAIIESIKEVIKIGKRSGVRVHFSHFKICGKKNWEKIDKVEELLDYAKDEGIKISFDQYPYIIGSTMFGAILPSWVHNGGTEKLLNRLESSKLRTKIINDIKEGIPGWDNFIDFAGLDGIYITSVKNDKNKDCVGKNLLEIAEMKGKDPYNAAFDLIYEEENAVGIRINYGKEDQVARLMQRPEQNVCTDGLLAGKPHPRVYGTYPRVLGKYVREEGLLSLEEAIHKMTLKPAEIFNLNNRGVLQKGKKADIVIFDSEKIKNKATFENPMQYPEGIETVIINGRPVIHQEKRSELITGEVIRR